MKVPNRKSAKAVDIEICKYCSTMWYCNNQGFCQKDRDDTIKDEARSVVSELFKDKVLSEYQFNLIMKAL